MPFLRLSRDRRGYENTYLLHTARHGEPPRVLYWYRTAPSVRVGRPALDEDAIRTIEEQHPEVDFDWSEILAVGAAISMDVEPLTPPRRRPASRPPRERAADPPSPRRLPDAVVAPSRPEPIDHDPVTRMEASEVAEPETPRGHDLLEGLVGREIATRLHARYAELSARISEVVGSDEAAREAWHARAGALDPDSWVTPDEILSGVRRADALFDQLRKDLLSRG